MTMIDDSLEGAIDELVSRWIPVSRVERTSDEWRQDVEDLLLQFADYPETDEARVLARTVLSDERGLDLLVDALMDTED